MSQLISSCLTGNRITVTYQEWLNCLDGQIIYWIPAVPEPVRRLRVSTMTRRSTEAPCSSYRSSESAATFLSSMRRAAVDTDVDCSLLLRRGDDAAHSGHCFLAGFSVWSCPSAHETPISRNAIIPASAAVVSCSVYSRKAALDRPLPEALAWW